MPLDACTMSIPPLSKRTAPLHSSTMVSQPCQCGRPARPHRRKANTAAKPPTRTSRQLSRSAASSARLAWP
eukprot:3997021-Prymnesium_polylepis.2